MVSHAFPVIKFFALIGSDVVSSDMSEIVFVPIGLKLGVRPCHGYMIT